jgi:hypothetical protein
MIRGARLERSGLRARETKLVELLRAAAARGVKIDTRLVRDIEAGLATEAVGKLLDMGLSHVTAEEKGAAATAMEIARQALPSARQFLDVGAFTRMLVTHLAGKEEPSSTASSGEPVKVFVPRGMGDHAELPFHSHSGSQWYENALAMNIEYPPIQRLRALIEERIGAPQLNFFTGWNPEGEAHITVITPVEFSFILQPYISIQEVDEIARSMNIQSADIEVLGIGHGEATKPRDGGSYADGETFFVIVRSQKLIEIRKAVHDSFVANGGDPDAWDPNSSDPDAAFYPHITIGYTGSGDIHVDDGLRKGKEYSLDARFELENIE